MLTSSINGWIVLDKPFGMGSTEAVAVVKALLRRTFSSQFPVPSKDWGNITSSRPHVLESSKVKVGHAGTLDPLASGILPIALGEATKAIRLIQDADKEYLFTVRWGFETDSGDLDGKVVASGQMPVASKEFGVQSPESGKNIASSRPRALESSLESFIGEIEQLPPIYSAGKINGKRAYEYAREGLEVEVRPRKVRVDSLALLEVREGEADFRVVCGKGTYVRSLARDIGRKLGCFGTVSALRRTRVGRFTEENAISLDKAGELLYSGELGNIVLPIELALDDILALEVEQSDAGRIRQGKRVSTLQMGDTDFAVATFKKKLLAIGRIENGVFKPERGFNHFNIGENDVGNSYKEAGANP